MGKVVLADHAGLISVEMILEPNEWKHTNGLRIQYADVRAFRVVTEEADGLLTRLGALQLDEALPHLAGFTHEIAFTCGSVFVVAADLVATWE